MITRESAVFMFCLLLAFVLLLLNKLAIEYEGDIQATVTYVNYPVGKIPAAPLPDKLDLRVKTTGFKLLLAKYLKNTKVEVNLSNTGQKKYALTEAFRPEIARHANYQLLGISPDTLYLQFENNVKKRVPVTPNILIIFKKQYDFKEPLLVNPDSITIEGPENVVAPIKNWSNEKLQFENLDKSLEGEVALIKSSHPMMKISPDKINYIIPVEEYTEKTVEVEIQKINMPKANEINIYPKKVKVVCRVGLSNYELVKPESFTVVADFSSVNFKKNKYVSVEIKKYPSFIKSLDYSPKSVEYIIYK